MKVDINYYIINQGVLAPLKNMTKKNYVVIAGIIKDARNKTIEHKEDIQAIRHIVSGLVKVLKEDNKRFDKTRFENAIYEN